MKYVHSQHLYLIIEATVFVYLSESPQGRETPFINSLGRRLKYVRGLQPIRLFVSIINLFSRQLNNNVCELQLIRLYTLHIN